eukprot:4194967-Lingulodinium_polyedra.AAC.1
MPHNDAVESAVRCRNGSQIARSRTPLARQFLGFWRARGTRKLGVREPLRRRTVDSIASLGN